MLDLFSSFQLCVNADFIGHKTKTTTQNRVLIKLLHRFLLFIYIYFFILHIENVLPSSGQLFPISWKLGKIVFLKKSCETTKKKKKIWKAHSQGTEQWSVF